MMDETTRQRMEDELRAEGINAPGARFSAVDAVDQGIFTMPISFGISQDGTDDMTDRIEPALTPDAWRYWLRDRDDPARAVATACDAVSFDLRQKPERLIALANAALPDDDPRKIRRHRIALLRYIVGRAPDADDVDKVESVLAKDFLDALESYLPPEG
jgi:hypothetical protein